MKKIYTSIVLVLFMANAVFAQSFSWASYSSGSASYSTSSVNVTMSSSISGGYLSSGYPQGVNTSSTGGTVNAASSYLAIGVNWPNKTTILTTTITFSTPVKGVSFYIYDIDYSNGNWDDKLTITATDNSNNTVYPSLNPSGSAIVSGSHSNVLEGNSNNTTFTNAPSTVTFSTNVAVKTITLLYAAGSNSPNNPSSQVYGIGTITTTTALPVTLISFGATKTGNDAKINWEADKQVNFDHYELERSDNGNGSFEKIASIGSSNSSTGKYSYTDYDVKNKMTTAYYRLKMVDIDGSYSYSKVVMVRFDSKDMITVLPNLVTSGQQLTVTIPSVSGNPYNLKLFNMSGQVMATKTQAGAGQVSFETSGLTKGIYVVTAENGDNAQSFKIMIQ